MATRGGLLAGVAALLVGGVAIAYFANAPDPAQAVAQAEQHTEDGKRLLATGDANGALASFESALKETPGVPALLFNAARAAAQAGRLDEAERRYRQAIAGLAPEEDWRFALGLGNLLLKTKRPQEAIQPLSRAIVLHDAVATHRSYQDALRASGQHDTAEKMYAERMAARGEQVDALYLYARLVKAPAGRAKVLRTALERDPDHVWSHLALGATYLEMQDGRSALKQFLAAQRLDPPSVKAWFGLVRAHLALDDEPAAREALKQLHERHPGSSATQAAQTLVDTRQW